MIRFFGMMPSTEIEKEKHYLDAEGRTYIIQAGPKGWTVLYPGHSSDYDDVEATTEDNFKSAYNVAIAVAGKLIEVEAEEEIEECCGEC